MDKGLRVVLALTFLTVAFSGCAKGGAEPKPSTPLSVVDGGVVDGAKISGTVVDDALLGIPNAQVAILTTNISVVTDGSGFFAIQNIAAGSYQLAAAALGYDSAAKKVEVGSEGATVQFMLAKIAVSEAYVEVLGPFQGSFGCRVGTPASRGACLAVAPVDDAAFPNDLAEFDLPMTDDTTAFVGEMRWAQGSAATGTELVLSFSYRGRSSFHWFCSDTANSPLQWVYLMDGGCQVDRSDAAQDGNADEPKEPSTDLELYSYANAPFGSTENPFHVALEQRFEVIYTIFHKGEPELSYTAFPDV